MGQGGFHSRMLVQNAPQNTTQQIAVVHILIWRTVAIGVAVVYLVQSKSKGVPPPETISPNLTFQVTMSWHKSLPIDGGIVDVLYIIENICVIHCWHIHCSASTPPSVFKSVPCKLRQGSSSDRR